MSNKRVRWMSYKKTWLYMWVTNAYGECSPYEFVTHIYSQVFLQDIHRTLLLLIYTVTSSYKTFTEEDLTVYMSNKHVWWMSYKKTWLYIWVTNAYGECLVRRLDCIYTFTVRVCYSYIQSSLLIRHSPYSFVTHIYSQVFL
jgi:formate/nitrite transporter FocA (FNT family)